MFVHCKLFTWICLNFRASPVLSCTCTIAYLSSQTFRYRFSNKLKNIGTMMRLCVRGRLSVIDRRHIGEIG
ncbi:hypothetical protein BDQ17DRAFT_1046394 [Cyathus striatus]|nr:hypothetical protein BDQ17DRAFT_1046394 [Cyathus striatus]